MKHQGDVELLAYEAIDGVPTLKDSQVLLLFRKAKAEGTLKWILYGINYDAMTEEQFLNWFKFGACKMWVVLWKGKLVGWIWIDDIRLKAGRLHYNFFRWAIKEGITGYVGRQCLKHFLNLKGRDGNHVFDVIRGETPSFNKLAVGYLKKLGMTIVGSIDQMAWSFDRQKAYPMIISYTTRDQLEE